MIAELMANLFLLAQSIEPMQALPPLVEPELKCRILKVPHILQCADMAGNKTTWA